MFGYSRGKIVLIVHLKTISCSANFNVGRMENWPVRLLFNACMLLGLLLPMLCLWADSRRHDPCRGVLRRKLLRQLLFVLHACRDDTTHRCTHRSKFHRIDHASCGSSDPFTDEVRNQKEAQDPWRRLRRLRDCLVLRLLCPCAGPPPLVFSKSIIQVSQLNIWPLRDRMM